MLNERKFVVVGERNAYLCNIDGDVSTRFEEATPYNKSKKTRG